MAFEPLPRPPYPVPVLPVIEKLGGTVYVGGYAASASALGAGVMNYTRYCKCGSCRSCVIGRTFQGPEAATE